MGDLLRVVVRAASLIGAVLVGWSNNVKWGTGPVRGGPPAQWERLAVGAALLAVLAALAVWLGTRAGAGPSRMWLRGAACAFAIGVVAVAIQLRARAAEMGLPDLLEGPGWTWLASGAGVVLAAAAGSFGLGSQAGARTGASQRSRGRRRGASPRAR